MDNSIYEPKICVLGLGYVGLPLLVELSKYFKVVGFDNNENRIKSLKSNNDINRETSSEALKDSNIEFSSDPSIIKKSNFIIIAVPTPIDKYNNPDLTPLYKASETVGKNIQKGSIVVYESTVYPGVTEDECVPVLEHFSQLKWKKDFFVGYSPERINPGDKIHTVSKITKIVSGDSKETLERVAYVYETMLWDAGIHKASSIKVAEAAKVIENTQRDINIALMNELKIIFDKLGISTKEVLEAAKTKWNFLPFEPGLVGGHCIGVDPYYLTYKATEIGYHPQLILSGRRINDSMGKYFAQELIKKMINNKVNTSNCKVLILGITFKENVPDIRNSKVHDIINELKEFGISVSVYDPVAIHEEVLKEYNIDLLESLESQKFDGILLAVKHKEFLEFGLDFYKDKLNSNGIFYDIKQVLE